MADGDPPPRAGVPETTRTLAERRSGAAEMGSARPLVIAHRGASGYRPENTFSAYELAIEQGADMIEIDLHRTRDHVTVVAHDCDLARLGGSGEISEHRAAEIRQLDAGGRQVVPTLEEVLDAFGSRIAFNLEFKSGNRADYSGIEEAALAAVESRGPVGSTLFSSFSDAILERLRGLSPRARIALLVHPATAAHGVERALKLAAEALNPWYELVNCGLVQAAHGAGLAICPFTVDDASEMRRLLDLGVDGIFTNYPDRLRALVDARVDARVNEMERGGI